MLDAAAELEELRDALYGADVRAELAWAAQQSIVLTMDCGAVAYAAEAWGLPVRVAVATYISPGIDVPGWLRSLLADRAAATRRPVVVAALPLVWSWPPRRSRYPNPFRRETPTVAHSLVYGCSWPTSPRRAELIVIDVDHCRDATNSYLPSHAEIVCHELGHLVDPHLSDRTRAERELYAWAVAEVAAARQPASDALFQAWVGLAEISGHVPSAPAVAAA